MDQLAKFGDQIRSLCVSGKVKSLFAFGSITREDFSVSSDIDLIVDIDQGDPITYANTYFELKFQLEKLFQRKVDLLEHHAIRNTYLQDEIDQTKVLIYAN